ncbi:MAG TPA: hypothetical protein VI039_06140 [Solirubrobacterales bacterium]
MRTKIADRANAVVWRLPVPRRARVLLSQLTYRNPPISSERVTETVRTLDQAGIEAILIGGWGVDALVGRQLRSHADLDLIVDEREFDRAIGPLRRLGFELWNHDPSPGPIGKLPISVAQTFRDSALRVVELHAADLGEVGATEGTIGGMRVACLSADHQLQAQHEMGRTLTSQRRLNRQHNLAAVRKLLNRDMTSA